jgi:hypothetical protein
MPDVDAICEQDRIADEDNLVVRLPPKAQFPIRARITEVRRGKVRPVLPDDDALAEAERTIQRLHDVALEGADSARELQARLMWAEFKLRRTQGWAARWKRVACAAWLDLRARETKLTNPHPQFRTRSARAIHNAKVSILTCDMILAEDRRKRRAAREEAKE